MKHSLALNTILFALFLAFLVYFMLAVFTIGVLIFNRVESTFMDTV